MLAPGEIRSCDYMNAAAEKGMGKLGQMWERKNLLNAALISTETRIPERKPYQKLNLEVS